MVKAVFASAFAGGDCLVGVGRDADRCSLVPVRGAGLTGPGQRSIAGVLGVRRSGGSFPIVEGFVDPDGFVCDRGYDLGVVIRSWTDEVLAAMDPEALLRGYCARLEASTGVDAETIWQWGFVERVSTGLFLIKHGHPVEGRTYLDSAERLV